MPLPSWPKPAFRSPWSRWLRRWTPVSAKPRERVAGRSANLANGPEAFRPANVGLQRIHEHRGRDRGRAGGSGGEAQIERSSGPLCGRLASQRQAFEHMRWAGSLNGGRSLRLRENSPFDPDGFARAIEYTPACFRLTEDGHGACPSLKISPRHRPPYANWFRDRDRPSPRSLDRCALGIRRDATLLEGPSTAMWLRPRRLTRSRLRTWGPWLPSIYRRPGEFRMVAEARHRLASAPAGERIRLETGGVGRQAMVDTFSDVARSLRIRRCTDSIRKEHHSAASARRRNRSHPTLRSSGRGGNHPETTGGLNLAEYVAIPVIRHVQKGVTCYVGHLRPLNSKRHYVRRFITH